MKTVAGTTEPEVNDLFPKNPIFAMLMLSVLRFSREGLEVFRRDMDANTGNNMVRTAVSIVVGLVALAIIVEIQTGDLLANASALVTTVVSFIPVLLALAILWATWRDAIGA